VSGKTYPNFEPAWVEDPASPGSWSLWWLDASGSPLELIGVDSEGDVPGIHTPEALAAIQAMPLDRQTARMWTQIPAPSDDAQGDAGA
jgi:hypothetical protein